MPSKAFEHARLGTVEADCQFDVIFSGRKGLFPRGGNASFTTSSILIFDKSSATHHEDANGRRGRQSVSQCDGGPPCCFSPCLELQVGAFNATMPCVRVYPPTEAMRLIMLAED